MKRCAQSHHHWNSDDPNNNNPPPPHWCAKWALGGMPPAMAGLTAARGGARLPPMAGRDHLQGIKTGTKEATAEAPQGDATETKTKNEDRILTQVVESHWCCLEHDGSSHFLSFLLIYELRFGHNNDYLCTKTSSVYKSQYSFLHWGESCFDWCTQNCSLGQHP